MGDKPPIVDAEFEVITGPNEPLSPPEKPEEWNGVGFPPGLVKERYDPSLWGAAKKLAYLAFVGLIIWGLAKVLRPLYDLLLAWGS